MSVPWYNPKEEEVSVFTKREKIRWLNTLYISNLNCSVTRSWSFVFCASFVLG